MEEQSDIDTKETDQGDSFHGWAGLSFLQVLFPQKQAVASSVPTEGDTTISHLPNYLIFFTCIIVALGFIGYETYFSAKSDTTIGKTLSNANSLENGLVGHWTFDGPDMDWSSSTAEVRDISSYHNNGNLMNSSIKSVTPGRLGQGIVFDGVNDYVSVPGFNEVVTSVTMSAWIKRTGIKDWAGIVFSRGTNTSGMSIRSLTSEIGYHWNDDSSTYNWLSGLNVPLNEWVFVVLTISPTEALFYMGRNGDIQSATHTYAHSASSLNSLNIGRDPTWTTFPGSIDDVRIYNRALTPAEITKLYKLGKGTTVGICGEGGVKDASGNTYGIVQIGTQCWLDRNMNVGTRISGATAQTNNASIEKWCYLDSNHNCTLRCSYVYTT